MQLAPVECCSPSGGGHHWPKHLQALCYCYYKTLPHSLQFKASFTLRLRFSPKATGSSAGRITAQCPTYARQTELLSVPGAYIYLLLVVYSFYCLLPMLTSERITILLERFKNPYIRHENESDLGTTERWGNATATPRFSGYWNDQRRHWRYVWYRNSRFSKWSFSRTCTQILLTNVLELADTCPNEKWPWQEATFLPRTLTPQNASARTKANVAVEIPTEDGEIQNTTEWYSETSWDLRVSPQKKHVLFFSLPLSPSFILSFCPYFRSSFYITRHHRELWQCN
jgi:hypothetical protein